MVLNIDHIRGAVITLEGGRNGMRFHHLLAVADENQGLLQRANANYAK